MQKIKNNENGVTLAALIITALALLILAGVSLSAGVQSLDQIKNKRIQAELEMVQQVIIAEYTKAKQLGYIDPNTLPPNFLGNQISVLDLPVDIDWRFQTEPTEKYKLYFELTPEHLEQLDILDSEYTYVVNYYTGEVYNKTKGNSMNNKLLYIKSTTGDHKEKDKDDESFSDWEE